MLTRGRFTLFTWKLLLMGEKTTGEPKLQSNKMNKCGEGKEGEKLACTFSDCSEKRH